MNAWITPMNMSNSFQTTVKTMLAGSEEDRQADQQGDHDPAGEEVAEEPQSQGDRLGDLLDDVEREHDAWACGRSA